MCIFLFYLFLKRLINDLGSIVLTISLFKSLKLCEETTVFFF
jgi:hypothetical protein